MGLEQARKRLLQKNADEDDNKLGAEFHKKFLSDGTAVSFKAFFFIISYMVSRLNSCIQILHTNCRKMNKKIDDFEK